MTSFPQGSRCDVMVKNGSLYEGIFKTLSSRVSLYLHNWTHQLYGNCRFQLQFQEQNFQALLAQNTVQIFPNSTFG